ncbi:hypothetical protein BKA66DRAFT_445050 [Pyrenochaeta sp. MPI-SDFR-AT-0127]|nr:hypothetical protein BKA66DRAFT_445050 [Pyrenochaeta sp. MPI-SDFR-AT-0127]
MAPPMAAPILRSVAASPHALAGMQANWVLDRRRTCPQFHVARSLRQLPQPGHREKTLDDSYPQPDANFMPAARPLVVPHRHERYSSCQGESPPARASCASNVKTKTHYTASDARKNEPELLQVPFHVEIHPPRHTCTTALRRDRLWRNEVGQGPNTLLIAPCLFRSTRAASNITLPLIIVLPKAPRKDQ